MKKFICIIVLICTFALCLTSCGKCERCGGSKTINCYTCNGKGKETCEMCHGYGNCWNSDCNGGKEKEACSNSNCNNGYVYFSSGQFNRLPCAECDGTGFEDKTCSICHGSDH